MNSKGATPARPVPLEQNGKRVEPGYTVRQFENPGPGQAPAVPAGRIQALPIVRRRWI